MLPFKKILNPADFSQPRMCCARPPVPRLASFFEAMDNDPGTPATLRALGELAGEILEGERTGG